MSRSGTFKIILTSSIALGLFFTTAWGFSRYLTTYAPVTSMSTAHAKPLSSEPKPAAAGQPAGQAMLFTVRASVSTEDGPVVSIDVELATGPCEEPRWLDARIVHVVKPVEPLDASSSASWCLQVMPGQNLHAETLPGRWVTVGDRVLELDAAHQYMRVQHASGRWLSLRALAAGYCATHSSACAGTALAEVTIDDQNLLVPVAISGRARDVLRLTSGAELDQIVERAHAARAARAEYDDIAVEDTTIESAEPAAEGESGAEALAQPESAPAESV